jgi:hypothetical protein
LTLAAEPTFDNEILSVIELGVLSSNPDDQSASETNVRACEAPWIRINNALAAMLDMTPQSGVPADRPSLALGAKR